MNAGVHVVGYGGVDGVVARGGEDDGLVLAAQHFRPDDEQTGRLHTASRRGVCKEACMQVGMEVCIELCMQVCIEWWRVEKTMV